MATRVFATQGEYKFVSDDRDIAVPYPKRQEVYAWSISNDITVEYQGTLGGLDVWRVRNEQDRAWFTLKWS